ncbi:MAG TPA: Gfo/Idh/MocA family oxidoreductase [Bacteroidales bacterium]|nr:Gfo/Idh/MocA family oxidoreductase [Bacteroidales bacterium]
MITNTQSLHFALIGAAGFVAPRHMKAIRDTGNVLVCALDPYDGVGILDSYFPNTEFFIEPERFDRHLDKLRRNAISGKGDAKVDYVSICSPNYMHDSHIRLALRNNAHAICEKPIVLNPWNLEALKEIEKETGKKVFTILQLRLHPSIRLLREEVSKAPADRIFDIDLTYITARGNWYYRSWKGDSSKSGGIVMNIGVHFFDVLNWVFGGIRETTTHLMSESRAAGLLTLERARVRWFLSIEEEDLPGNMRREGKRVCRSLSLDGRELEFSDGFTDLHTEMYREILAGRGFGILDARQAIETVYGIRQSKPAGITGEHHPFLSKR